MAAGQRWAGFLRAANESLDGALQCFCGAVAHLCRWLQGPGGRIGSATQTQTCCRPAGKSPRDILRVHPDMVGNVLFLHAGNMQSNEKYKRMKMHWIITNKGKTHTCTARMLMK